MLYPRPTAEVLNRMASYHLTPLRTAPTEKQTAEITSEQPDTPWDNPGSHLVSRNNTERT